MSIFILSQLNLYQKLLRAQPNPNFGYNKFSF